MALYTKHTLRPYTIHTPYTQNV